MKISNLFESTSNSDFGVLVVNYSREANMNFGGSLDWKQNGQYPTPATTGIIYYFLLAAKKVNMDSIDVEPLETYKYKFCDVNGNDVIDVKPQAEELYTLASRILLLVRDCIQKNNWAKKPNQKLANDFYKSLLTNGFSEYFDEDMGESLPRFITDASTTLEDLANDLRDHAVEVADILKDGGFTTDQIWGRYSVSKFEQVFLTFVRNYINTRVK